MTQGLDADAHDAAMLERRSSEANEVGRSNAIDMRVARVERWRKLVPTVAGYGKTSFLFLLFATIAHSCAADMTTL